MDYMNILVCLGKSDSKNNELLSISEDIKQKHTNVNIYTIYLDENKFKEKRNIKNWDIKKNFIIEYNKHNSFNMYDISEIIEKIVKKVGINIILMGNTISDMELAPYIAEGLEYDYIPNVASTKIENNKIFIKRLIYGTRAFEESSYNLKNIICTFTNNSYNKKFSNNNFFIENEKIKYVSSGEKKYIIKKVELKKLQKYPLESSKIVIGVGKGIKDIKNFEMIEELAKVLGAGIGATRSVVDNGWRPEYEKIGQTGKIIKPELYIALGLSGAMQHVAGVKQSRHIISINNNPNAEIFRDSDLGIVGDIFDIIPFLIERLKNI